MWKWIDSVGQHASAGVAGELMLDLKLTDVLQMMTRENVPGTPIHATDDRLDPNWYVSYARH